MGRFTDWLKTKQPRTGRMVLEDGEHWNEADRGRFKEQYDVTWQTIDNGAVRMSGRERGIDVDEYWIGVDVPSGRQLVIWSDALKLSENEYDIDVFDAPDGFTGGTEKVKRTLGAVGADTVQSALYFGVTPTDTATHVIRLEDYIDAGSIQGPGRPTAAPDDDDAFQTVRDTVLIRITRREGGGAYALSYRMIAWEEDDPDA